VNNAGKLLLLLSTIIKIVITAVSPLTGTALTVLEPPKCFGAGCVPGIENHAFLKIIIMNA
jgi:hypothetical protein